MNLIQKIQLKLKLMLFICKTKLIMKNEFENKQHVFVQRIYEIKFRKKYLCVQTERQMHDEHKSFSSFLFMQESI